MAAKGGRIHFMFLSPPYPAARFATAPAAGYTLPPTPGKDQVRGIPYSILPYPVRSVINLIRTQIEFDFLDNEKTKLHLSLQGRTLCRCSFRDEHEHSTVSILRVYSHGALALTLALMPELASQWNALVSSVSFIASWSTTASNFKWILDLFGDKHHFNKKAYHTFVPTVRASIAA